MDQIDQRGDRRGRNAEHEQNSKNPLWEAEMKSLTLLLFPLGLSIVSTALSYVWFSLLKTENDGETAEEPAQSATNIKALTKDSSLLPRQMAKAKPFDQERESETAKSAKPMSIKPIETIEPIEPTSKSLAKPDGCPMLRLEPGSQYSGGEIVVEALRLVGVERLFGIPGVQNLALYRAICRPQGREVAMHLIGNEEAAAYMAWGVWHNQKRLGCACLIGGPGVTHALAGVACAFRDGTPMLVLTSGVRAGNERFQLHDVDNLAVLKPICKALFRPASVQEIATAIAEAAKCCLEGRPGPVGIEISCDMYNKCGPFEWDHALAFQSVQEPSLITRPVPAVQARHASDPVLAFIKFLVSQAKNCTLVAEPGYCAEIAAMAWESDDRSWQLLCPGCGSRPSTFAAESPGVAVPSAIGVARGEATSGEGGKYPGVVITFCEASALVPQGLELSHAQGLPLLLVVLQDQTVDAVVMAESISFNLRHLETFKATFQYISYSLFLQFFLPNHLPEIETAFFQNQLRCFYHLLTQSIDILQCCIAPPQKTLVFAVF